MAVTGWNVTYTAVGLILVYSGYKGTKISTTFTDLLKGQLDSTDEEPINQSSGSSLGESGVTAQSDYTVAGSFSTSELETLWTKNGGPSDTAAFAAKVAQAESSGNPKVTSANPDGGKNVGLWQLDTPGGVGAGHSVSELQNPDLNAAITIAATNGGLNWTEWGDPVTAALPNHQYTPGS